MDCLRLNDAPGDRARRSLQLWVAVCLLGLAMSAVGLRLFAAGEHHGQVMFGGLPVPGVTVTVIVLGPNPLLELMLSHAPPVAVVGVAVQAWDGVI